MQKREKEYWALTGMLVALYAGFMLYACVHTKALSIDEASFLNTVNAHIQLDTPADVLRVPNLLQYGAIYWIILKLIGNLLGMRLLMFALLMSVLGCVIATNIRLTHSARCVFMSCVLYLSCPLSWFTGKIIGPEIMGLAFGAGGGYAALTAFSDAGRVRGRRLAVAGVLLGLSMGVKLNYAVFVVFVAVYGLLKVCLSQGIDARRRAALLVKSACCGGGALIAGFVLSNPIMLTDFQQFRQTYNGVGGFSVRYLGQTLFRRYIEWDLVNSGGMTNTIISIIGLVAVFVGCFLCRKDRALGLAGVCATVVLVGICCKPRFLGWYLLPMIYIVCVMVPDARAMAAVLALNLALMAPNIAYQMTSKIEWIHNVARQDSLAATVSKWADDYEDYERYVYVEVSTSVMPYHMVNDYVRKVNAGTLESTKRIFFISERAKANGDILDICERGLREQDGYRIAGEDNGITIVVYEKAEKDV